MKENQLIGVISAYGSMTECDNRYRALIHAENAEEFNAKLKTFMLGETVRAMSMPEISREIGPVNPVEVYETLVGFTFPKEGERSVIEVQGLCTDYHVENPEILVQTSPDDDISTWREAIVMTDYGNECGGRSEFPSVVAIYDPAKDLDEDGNPRIEEYTDCYHGTILMRPSELESHLLGWDRHVVPVM